MKNVISGIVLVVLSSFNLSAISEPLEKFVKVEFGTEDGATIHASLFEANTKKAVIFAHGAIFDKESWYFLAEKFVLQNVTALAIDFRGYGKSKGGSTSKKMYDIIGAINYLRSQGFSDINIVGGSMGGAAVLNALTIIKEPVNKVALLASAGGMPIASSETEKLFIVSKEEGFYSRVINVYQESSEPKELKEYNGSAHAQHMFKEDYADELALFILNFIGKG